MTPIYTNTEYKIFSPGKSEDGKPWGFVTAIDGGFITVSLADDNGTVNFTKQEMFAWINERVIAPVCGICGRMIGGGHLDDHLKTHTIKLFG